MQAERQIYEHLPARIEVPVSLRNRRVEVTLQALDEVSVAAPDRFHFAPVAVDVVVMPNRQDRNARR